MGGPAWWAEHTGSVPNASFTVTKLRWLADHEPDNAARIAPVLLPHDWLTWRLGATEPVTDRGDASGTGYFSPATGRWLPDLAAAALGHEPGLPRVAKPAEAVGETAEPGRCSRRAPATTWARRSASASSRVSLSSPSGRPGRPTRSPSVPAADASGAVAGFADATGRFLPLVATVNAGLVLSATAVADRHRPGRARRPGAGGRARRGRDHPAALPGRRADPEPSRRDRRAARPDDAERHHARISPGPRSRPCSPRSPRPPTCSPPRACRAPPGAADRRRGALAGGPRHRARHLRRAGRRAGAGGVRRPGRGPPGRLGAGGHPGPARLATPAAREEYTGPPQPAIRERLAALREATTTWGKD